MNKNIKISDEKYRNLLDHSPHMIFTIDLKGNFLFGNNASLKAIGGSLSEFVKKDIWSFVTPDYHGMIQNMLDEAPKKKFIPPLEVEAFILRGKRIPLELHVHAIKDKQDKIIGIQAIARDITRQKKTQNTLQESEKKYRNLVDNSSIGIYKSDLRGQILYANKALVSMFEYDSQEDLISAGALKLYKKRKERETFLAKLKKTGKLSNQEIEILTKKGKTKNILLSATLEKDVLSGMIIDITERKKAEQRIKKMVQQNEKFSEISADLLFIEDEKELFDHISQAVVDISDFDRVLISFFTDTPPYREIIGYKGVKKAEIERVSKINMPSQKYKKIYEKGIKIGNQSCYIPHDMKQIIDQKAVIYGKKIYPKKEGAWHREDNLIVFMKDVTGKLMGIISVDDSKSGLIPTDETVRPLEIFANLISGHIQRRLLARKIKESEEKYKELVSNIKVGIFRVTPKGKLLEANPAGVEMFGYRNPADLLSYDVSHLYKNPEDRQKFLKEMKKNGMVKNMEIQTKKKDGTLFWASITSSAVKDSTGKIIYHDTVIEDIDERKNLEEEVKRLSITDELTGLYNRRYFNQNLPKEIKRSERWKRNLSLIMLDIDDFKEYNDLYHHLKGDEILKEIARVISRIIRKDVDWASRFGGEEFTVILPGVRATEAFLVAERIRKTFEKINFKPKGKIIHKTVSGGIAQFKVLINKIPQGFDYLEFRIDYERIATNLTNLADKALFQAKKTGKNRIVISDKEIKLDYTSS